MTTPGTRDIRGLNNIVLIGYRGTGKTPIARWLASTTGRDLFCMDARIAERAGCPIAEYVQREGWEAFRDLESAVALEAAAQRNAVIDCGGGVVLRRRNVDALKATGVMIWLTATVATIAARIAGDGNRPSLTGTKSAVEEIEEVLAQREPLYRAAADFTVDTDAISGETAGQLIQTFVDG